MEESMNMNEQTTQAENMGNESPAQNKQEGAQGSNSEKEPRLFTQEEVNSFVQSRVSRLKAQLSKEIGAEYEKKSAELESREKNLMIREELSRREMPKELADLISCTDADDLKEKLDILQRYAENPKETEEKTGFFTIDPKTGKKQYLARRDLRMGLLPQREESVDPIREAMGLNKRKV